jgi:hypothetical protein
MKKSEGGVNAALLIPNSGSYNPLYPLSDRIPEEKARR